MSFEGNWACSKCGTAITSLPFEPDAGRLDQLLCRDCHREKVGAQNNRGGGFGGGFQRRMYQGNWQCSGCGTEITELPFEPRPDGVNSLFCRECYKKKRES